MIGHIIHPINAGLIRALLLRDSDRSPKGGNAEGGAVEDEGAGPKDIAQKAAE